MTTSTSPIVAFLVDAQIPQTLQDAVDLAAPGWRVVATPYIESTELRTSRGRNGGQNLEGIAAPEITDEMKAVWREAVAMIVVDLPDNLETLAPNLTWVQSATAGYDKYDLAALGRQGVQLSTASGVGSASISEFVMARLLQVWKNLRTFDEQQAKREWAGIFGTELTGRTIAIIGLGAIGRDVAKRARAFGMRTVATRASATPGATDPDVDQLLPAAELDTAMAQADAVVAALPANPATHDLFNAERFAAMKPGAIFCNVGRGTHVVEADLIAALESGHLGAAALDVARSEPLPTDDPLWAAPNLYLSPHSSVSLDRYFQNFEAIFLRNLESHIAGETLHNQIDLPTEPDAGSVERSTA